jgi:DNA-binding response OmpR family regulator
MEITEAGRKILFAEDDDAMRRFVEIILRKENYEVVSVEDGLKAMQIAFETKPLCTGSAEVAIGLKVR